MDGIVRLLRALESFFDTRWGRRLLLVVLAATFAAFGAVAVMRAEIPRRRAADAPAYRSPMDYGEREDAQTQWRSSEFRGFRRCAWGPVMEGLDPYDASRFHVRAYPPFFSIAFFPFASVWRVTGLGSALFFAVSFLLLLVSAACLSRWTAPPDAPFRMGRFAVTLLLLAPMALNVIGRLESDLLVIGPISAAMLWLCRGQRRFAAGMLLGFAASFKVVPGLFGVYLICTRQWRALSGMVVGGILCTVLLPAAVFGPRRAWDLHVSWYRNIVAPYHTHGADALDGIGIAAIVAPSNQALAGAANRFLTGTPVEMRRRAETRSYAVADLAPGTVRRVVKFTQLVVAIALITTWVLCGRSRGTPSGTVAVLFGAVGCGILLLSDLALTTHHVLLFPALAAVLGRAWHLEEPRAVRWSWVIALYLLGILGSAFWMIKPFAPLLPVTIALCLAMLVLAWRDRISKSGGEPGGSRQAAGLEAPAHP